jgi:hypothetical protein
VKDQYTAVLKKKGNWWIGWIEEVPGVNCQERSKENLLETLCVTLREALEFNRFLGPGGTRSEFNLYRGGRVDGHSKSVEICVWHRVLPHANWRGGGP